MELGFDHNRLADMIKCLLCAPTFFCLDTGDSQTELTLKLGPINDAKLQTEILEWLIVPERIEYRNAKKALEDLPNGS